MNKIKISTLVLSLVFLGTSTVFASWWNPFTWSFFTKKQNQKIENTVSVKDTKVDDIVKQGVDESVDKKDNATSSSVKTEKTGLFISTSTSKLIFTESEKLINYSYKDFRCGGYEPIPNCEDDIVTYDVYKGSKIDIKGVSYSHVGNKKQKVIQTFDIDISTFKFVDNALKEVEKIIKTGGMTKTTLTSSSNYEEITKNVDIQATPKNPVKSQYLIGQDSKNKYYLVITRYGCGGDVIGCVGNSYVEQVNK